jgi:transglutaminase-like putative cysteine protease
MKLRALFPSLIPRVMRQVGPVFSRDKSDTLLLLSACALVLAPHAMQVPPWVAAIAGALLLWRAWITFRGNRLPPRWLLLPLAGVAMAGIFISFKTLLGREAGVATLVLLLAFKLLEMHARRDLLVVLFLGFFLILASFFYSQGMGAALLAVLSALALLSAQLSFQFTGAAPPLLQRLGLGLKILAFAVPLTLLMFYFFPRIQGPLWGLPSDAQTGRSGLSDNMAPGNIARLALSGDVAFRVKFIDPAPPQSKLYWRGIVLDNYDGRNWTQQATPPASAMPDAASVTAVRVQGPALRHQVTLEPHGKRWLFALELPQSPPNMPGLPAAVQTNGELLADRPIHDRIRYTAISHVDFTLQADVPRSVLRRWLALPVGYNPATLNFAAALRRTFGDDLQFANAVLRHFREQPFVYTLEPPPLGRNAMDDFLFGTRAGFCEHYASAFVVLMRAAGIPARVVTGYQGGEINPVDGFMTIRQSDAHAWAEIWIADRGWLRVDPTAAVAPNRIERNLARTLPQGGLVGTIELNPVARSWLASLRFNWDAVNNGWNQWVLNYSADKQKSLLQSLGFSTPDWRTLAAFLGGGAALLALLAWPLLIDRRKIDPVHAVYLRFCQVMAHKGVPRAMHEGPRTYRQRIMQSPSRLSDDKKIAAERFLMCYEDAQYGTVSDFSVTAYVARLKLLLKQCR